MKGPTTYKIPIPIIMTQFMAPVALVGADFLGRWDRLSAPGLENVIQVPSTLSTQLAMVKLQQLKLGVAPDLGPTGSILCASTLQTGFVAENGSKVVVGCMLQIHVQPGSVGIAVRTASQQVTTCLSGVMANLLKTN